MNPKIDKLSKGARICRVDKFTSVILISRKR